jgi:hypothetical protein
MIARARLPLILFAALLAAAALASPASAAPARAAWKLSLVPIPANLAPGAEGELQLRLTNVGGAASDGSAIDLEVTLPEQLEVVGASGIAAHYSEGAEPQCTVAGQLVTCTTDQQVQASDILPITITYAVAPATTDQTLSLDASVQGGGGLGTAIDSELVVSADPLFGFLGPLTAPLTNPDGTPATQAGGHPAQYTVDFNFPTVRTVAQGGDLIKASDPVRTILTDLPPGLIADPAATPRLCTEAEFLQLDDKDEEGCPFASQVGVIDITTAVAGVGGITPVPSPLYNMVPPPGAPAELAFDAASAGIKVHLIAGVRSDSDYGAYAEVEDALALGLHPLFGAQAKIWGDPSSHAYDLMRGYIRASGEAGCLKLFVPCEVADAPSAFLTNPVHCTGAPDTTEVAASTWGAPETFTRATYASADLEGNQATMSGCNALSFEPTITASPTTNLADSPSGLDVDLHQPQDLDKHHTATAELKDASVTLPAGMSVNPSQADGLGACSLAQIGFTGETAAGRLDFSKQPNSCPDAAKLGTAEVTTPLLAERNAAHELELNPETGQPIPTPLHGAVYLAEPFHNPFDSLLAIYLAVEDPLTGTIAKLAGRVEPDPQTGQLTTVFEENPQLPIEDIRLHLFGGARGALITPPSCGTHTTTTSLVPWSAPETPEAHPSSSFQTTAMPGPGACPASPDAAANAPTFSAGTTDPQAGAYSPFVLKLSREDGTQRLSGFDTLLPPGLTGKLTGIPACTEAGLAQAAARSNPEEGILERNNPSCPAASALGTVTVGAGAGPTPFYTQGTAYLAGPYKGAPLSMAVITPAIAGPFDLGTVVVRAALYLDPDTARIHAVSDPFPTILHGIPLDLRSVVVDLDRPDFTLNPTSCDPLAITGSATSVFDQAAPLSQRFQVGGCSSLPFGPKLSLALKGSVKRSAHPSLIARLRARPGEANIARAQVKLPHAVFLDQAHIRTVCTRVQWAADTCPTGSVYGRAEATTPLLGYPLAGLVYLRSSNHPLPDLVAKLKGPASQPIEIDLAGKTDSVKAALRNTFEAVPDAPVSRFRLELFGGKRGLVEMSDGFCSHRKANVQLTAQNGKTHNTRPVVGAKCPKPNRHGKHHHRRHGHRGGHGSR